MMSTTTRIIMNQKLQEDAQLLYLDKLQEDAQLHLGNTPEGLHPHPGPGGCVFLGGGKVSCTAKDPSSRGCILIRAPGSCISLGRGHWDFSKE